MITVLEIDEDATAYRKQIEEAYLQMCSGRISSDDLAALVDLLEDEALQQAVFTAP